MKTHFLKVLILFLFFPLFIYSQVPPPPIQVPPPPIPPRTTGQNSQKSELYAIINNPQDGSSFKDKFEVNGIAKNIPVNNHLWLVVSPRESLGCWPQYREIIPNKASGTWNGKVEIGGEDGKLLDILLVCANSDANKYFVEYIINQNNDKFPERPIPDGAKILAKITVIKATQNSIYSSKVNLLYGFTKTGVFYIHKSLIEQANGNTPCLVAGVTNYSKNVPMLLDGDYYIYEAKIDKPYDIKLKYCFYIGNGIHIPQILKEKSSNLIIIGDYIANDSNDGSNFYTSPQDHYPQ